MALQLEKVLISDEIDEKCVNILKENGIQVEKKTKLTKDQLIAEIPEYDGLIVRSSTKVTPDVLAAASRLKIVGRAGTGVDNIDCAEATRCGVIVMNTPGGNTLSAAEHTCAMICSLSREIPEAVASLKAGKWERKRFMGNELSGKTLAIIGLGRIGRYVATRMQAFGMTTIGFDPLVSANESAEFGVEWLSLAEIWPRCDYVTVHTPLIPQTRNLVGEAVFNTVKPGLRVVNVARGGIVDEAALLVALNNGKCGGAALDVYTTEPPTNTALIAHPRVICTPHLGANTHEAQTRVAEEIAQQFVDVKRGTSLFGAINAQAMTDSLNPACQPLITLTTCLGKLSAALVGGVQDGATVVIDTHGDNLERSDSYLKAAVAVGLLASPDTPLNLVSAPALAATRNIQISCNHKDALPTYTTTCITITITNRDQSTIRVGGVPGPLGPVLVMIGDTGFESPFTLKGSVVVVKAKDTSEFLTCTAGAITNGNHNSLLGVSVSAAMDGEVWGCLQTATPLSDTKTLRGVTQSVTQIQF